MHWMLVGLAAYAAGTMQFWHLCKNAPVFEEGEPALLEAALPASTLCKDRRDSAQHDRQVPAQAPAAGVV